VAGGKLRDVLLSADIGDWVLRTACAQNAEWQKTGLPLVPIAVNISARQLLQQEIVPEVANILRATGLEPRWLELEITESVIARDIEKVAAIIAQLKALRVGFAIDDFGTGYSSLSYLKRFRVDRLKIDQSFVRHVSTDIGDAAIARAVISLAKGLRLEVTAEGVETAAQCRFLRRHGCDEIQGYYFSRPVSTNQLARMLRDGTRLLQEPAEAM
jgi:EAL domain-containing protein (putative c-di-GMP-specific phosphodiesterase class I)